MKLPSSPCNVGYCINWLYFAVTPFCNSSGLLLILEVEQERDRQYQHQQSGPPRFGPRPPAGGPGMRPMFGPGGPRPPMMIGNRGPMPGGPMRGPMPGPGGPPQQGPPHMGIRPQFVSPISLRLHYSIQFSHQSYNLIVTHLMSDVR